MSLNDAIDRARKQKKESEDRIEVTQNVARQEVDTRADRINEFLKQAGAENLLLHVAQLWGVGEIRKDMRTAQGSKLEPRHVICRLRLIHGYETVGSHFGHDDTGPDFHDSYESVDLAWISLEVECNDTRDDPDRFFLAVSGVVKGSTATIDPKEAKEFLLTVFGEDSLKRINATGREENIYKDRLANARAAVERFRKEH